MGVRRFLVLTFLLLVAATGCDRPGSGGETLGSLGQAPARTPQKPDRAAFTLASAKEVGEGARRIRTATLSLEVADLAASEREVLSAIASLGGYVQDSRASGEGSGRTTSYVLRIPAGRLDAAVSDLGGLGKVRESSTQTQDVTETYADLEMRVRVKKGVEERLRAILDQRAGKLSEVLEVENELARVVEEVERLETALQGYDRQIAWSTLKLDLVQNAPIVQAGFPENVAASFRDGMATFAAAVSAVVYLVTFLAPWLLFGSVLLWAVLRVRRRAAA
jgi:hypothetical protein